MRSCYVTMACQCLYYVIKNRYGSTLVRNGISVKTDVKIHFTFVSFHSNFCKAYQSKSLLPPSLTTKRILVFGLYFDFSVGQSKI